MHHTQAALSCTLPSSPGDHTSLGPTPSRAPGTGINPDFACVAPREAQGPHRPLWSAHSCQRSQEATTGSLYKAASIQASKKELLHP